MKTVEAKASRQNSRKPAVAPKPESQAAVDSELAQVSEQQAGLPQRKCACGGGCRSCRASNTEIQTQQVIHKMESAFAMRFPDVQIHTDGEAAAKAASLGTRAWTDGRTIGFATNAFQPETREGKRLVAHEFAHVAQIRGGTERPAGNALALGNSRGPTMGKVGNKQRIEREANAAARDIVEERNPSVSSAVFDLALDDGDENRGPPPGSVETTHDEDGNWVFIFNAADARSWEQPLFQVFRHYVRRAFNRGSFRVADVWLSDEEQGGTLYFENGGPREEGDAPFEVTISARLHRDVVDWMQRNFPEVTPRDVGVFHEIEGLPTDEGEDGIVPVSEDARTLLELYQYLLEQFGGHSVFTERHARRYDILRYHGENPEVFEGLPEQTENSARTQQAQWTEFLDGWDEFLIRGEHGHPEGEEGGADEGIVRFNPRAELLLNPDLPSYVQGSEVTAEVLFDRNERHNAMMNVFPYRASFDWTIWRDNEVYDSGPFLEGSGDRTYGFDVDDLGTYAVEVMVTSHYFRDPPNLHIISRNFLVQTEAQRSLDSFDQFFVDANDPDMPFVRNAQGELELKPDYQGDGLDIRRQISQVEFQLGMLNEMERQCQEDSGQCRLSLSDIAAYRAHFEQRLASMEAVRDRIEEATSAGTAAPAYLVRASFISRETSEAAPLNVDMIVTQRLYDISDDELRFGVMLFDTTFTPDNPQQHDGEAELNVESESQARWVRVEKQALDEMADHWHSNNDYPDGSIRVAVQLISDPGQIYEIPDIDTDNLWKSAQTGLTVIGVVAGVGALVLAPFTGGTSAAVGVLILEGVAAGAAISSVALSIRHRYETEGEVQPDRRLAMDMLTVAASLLGVFGSFARMLSNGARVAGAARTFVQLERAAIGLDAAAASADVISGILLKDDVSRAIVAVEAEYALRIEQARQQHQSAADIRQLEEQRDRIIARILGGAAISGGFILVSVGSSVFQIAASPLRNGRSFRVRQEIQDLGLHGSRSDIQSRLEEASLTPDEQAFLRDALAAPDSVRAEAGEIEAGRPSPGETAEVRPEPGRTEADIEATRPGDVGETGRVEEPDAPEPGRPADTDVETPPRVETEEAPPARPGTAEPEAPARPHTPEEQLRADLGDDQFDALSATLGSRLQDALANLGPRGVARIARALSPDEFAALARHLGDADILRLVRELPRQHIRTIIRRNAAHVFADLINDLGHATLGRLVHLIGGDSLITILTRVTTRRLADYVGHFGEQAMMRWVRALDADNVGAIMRAYRPAVADSLLSSPPPGRRTLPDPLQNLARLAWRRLGRQGVLVPHGGAVSVPRQVAVGPAPVETVDIGVFYAHGSRAAAPPELTDAVDLIRRETARQATELRNMWTRAASVGHSETSLQALFNGTGGLPNWTTMPQYLKRYLMTPHTDSRLQAYFGTALDRRTASALDALSGYFAGNGITVNSQTPVRGGIADLILDGPWGRAILDWTSLREAGKIQKYRVTPTTSGAGTSFANRVTQFLIELLHPGAL